MEPHDSHNTRETSTREQEIAWLLEEKYGGEKTEGFFADCAQLEAGEPLAYLIGHIPFLGCTIWLDSHPLIPRPETEFWVENAIKEISASAQNMEKSDTSSDGVMSPPQRQSPERGPGRSTLSDDVREKNVRILDLCAGSGCIGVAVAKAMPDARVDFCEIDARHHATILKNIQENDIAENRTAIFGGDLFSEIPKGTLYDFILTTPPYIDPALKERTEKSVTDHEPSLALWGGEKGLELIYTVIAQAPAFLTKDGVLYIEHEPEQATAIAEHAKKHHFLSTALQDQYGVIRTSRLVRVPHPVAQ